MSLKDTTKHLRDLLSNISADLDKAEGGNKAASQRVRTGTVKLEKIAKAYRKLSIDGEKKGHGPKRAPKAKAKTAKASAHKGTKTAAHKASKAKAHTAKAKAKPAAHSKTKKTSFHARPMSVKRATAKLPTKRFGLR